MTMSNGVEKKEILEARCGTTTQRDEFPYEVRERIPRNRHLPPNSLILHQVIDRGGRTFWRSQIHWRSKQVRFVKNLPHVSAYLPQDLSDEIELT